MENVPSVHIYMWSGVSKEAEERVVKGTTRVFGELRMPGYAVEVVMLEVPRGN